MGIISNDKIVLDMGLEITDYYVNIDNIRINKSQVEDYKYEVSSTSFYYINKEARKKFKPTFKQHPVVFTTDAIDDIQTQAYTELKKQFTNFTDDFEPTIIVSDSNTASTEETSNTVPAEESTTAESNTTPESTTV